MVKMLRSRMSPRHVRLMELLVEARTRAGLTQVELSERLCRPQSYVSKFETGERRLDLMEFLEVVEAIKCDQQSIIRQVMRVEA